MKVLCYLSHWLSAYIAVFYKQRERASLRVTFAEEAHSEADLAGDPRYRDSPESASKHSVVTVGM